MELASQVQNEGLERMQSVWGLQRHGQWLVYCHWKVNRCCNQDVRGIGKKAWERLPDANPPNTRSSVWTRQMWIWLWKHTPICMCMNPCTCAYICVYVNQQNMCLLFGHSFIMFVDTSQTWNVDTSSFLLPRKGLNIPVGVLWLWFISPIPAATLQRGGRVLRHRIPEMCLFQNSVPSVGT